MDIYPKKSTFSKIYMLSEFCSHSLLNGFLGRIDGIQKQFFFRKIKSITLEELKF